MLASSVRQAVRPLDLAQVPKLQKRVDALSDLDKRGFKQPAAAELLPCSDGIQQSRGCCQAPLAGGGDVGEGTVDPLALLPQIKHGLLESGAWSQSGGVPTGLGELPVVQPNSGRGDDATRQRHGDIEGHLPVSRSRSSSPSRIAAVR